MGHRLDWFLTDIFLLSDPTAYYQLDAFLHDAFNSLIAEGVVEVIYLDGAMRRIMYAGSDMGMAESNIGDMGIVVSLESEPISKSQTLCAGFLNTEDLFGGISHGVILSSAMQKVKGLSRHTDRETKIGNTIGTDKESAGRMEKNLDTEGRLSN